MLNLDFLPHETKKIFDVLAKQKFIKNYTLVGGTALSVQIEHRKSEDLDFIVDGETINSVGIKRSINSIFSKYKIINEDKDYQIDFVIDDVKVTFFSAGAVLVPFSVNKYSIRIGNINIAEPDIIGVLKLITISQRNTIRDYYDLYFITRKVINTEKLINLTKKLVPNLAPITYTETLTYTADIEELNIKEHLDPVENISKGEIAKYFVEELRKIKNKI